MTGSGGLGGGGQGGGVFGVEHGDGAEEGEKTEIEEFHRAEGKGDRRAREGSERRSGGEKTPVRIPT